MRCNGRLQGFKQDELNTERFLNLRYDGTDVPVMTQCAEGDDYAKVGISPDHACSLCLQRQFAHESASLACTSLGD